MKTQTIILAVVLTLPLLSSCAVGTFKQQETAIVELDGMKFQVQKGYVEYTDSNKKVTREPRRHVIIGGQQYLCPDASVSDLDCTRIMLKLHRQQADSSGDY